MKTLLQKSYYTHIVDTLKLSWPVIAGQLGHMIIGQVDNYMIGDLGSVPLAAASLANGVFFLIMVFGFGICAAISPICSKAVGAHSSDEEKSAILMVGLRIILIISVFIIICIYGLKELLPFLGQEKAVVAMAQSFLTIIGWSILPMLLFLVLKHFMDGFGDTIPAMFFMLLMVLVNILFNWIFIYGKWGIIAMGLDGAAWATLLSRVTGLLLFFIYFIQHTHFKKYLQFKDLFKRNSKIFKHILSIGIPSGLQYLFEVGAFSGAVILAGKIGANEQSAHQIAISIASITYVFYMGISSAAAIRIGYAFGQANLQYIKQAGTAALIITIFLIFIFIVLIFGFRTSLSQLYIDNEEVQAITFKLLWIAAIFQIFDGVQAVVQGMLRGIEDVKIPSFLSFVAYWIIGLPTAYAFSVYFHFGVEGIWWSLTIGLVFSALFLSIRFFNVVKYKKLKPNLVK